MIEISAGLDDIIDNNDLRGFTCSSNSASFEQVEPEIEIKEENKTDKQNPSVDIQCPLTSIMEEEDDIEIKTPERSPARLSLAVDIASQN